MATVDLWALRHWARTIRVGCQAPRFRRDRSPLASPARLREPSPPKVDPPRSCLPAGQTTLPIAIRRLPFLEQQFTNGYRYTLYVIGCPVAESRFFPALRGTLPFVHAGAGSHAPDSHRDSLARVRVSRESHEPETALAPATRQPGTTLGACEERLQAARGAPLQPACAGGVRLAPSAVAIDAN